MMTYAVATVNTQYIGMGELVVARDDGLHLGCVGLGSCIAICAFDPYTRVGGVVHVVLPTAPEGRSGSAGKYADTAVPALVTALRQAGAHLGDVRVALCGGAGIFTTAVSSAQIGQRNILAVRHALTEARLHVVREEVGGSEGRTVLLHLDTGAVYVRSVRQGERVLTYLGGMV